MRMKSFPSLRCALSICYAAFLVAIAAGLILNTSCSRERLSSPDDNHGFDLAQAEVDMAEQLVYYGDLAGLAAAMDTTAALDSLVSMLESDPEVDWAANVHTGVNVQWKSGLRGFIVLRTLARQIHHGAPGALEAPRESPLRDAAGRTSAPSGAALYTTPKHRKSLFLAPCYSEFRVHDDTVIDKGRVELVKAGYDTFSVYKEEQADLARFRSIASGNYGIVRISSHGAPYPDTTTIQDVYLLTGERATPQRNAANQAQLDLGNIGITSYYGDNYYSITADYVTSFNSFGDAQPLFLNGFCFGHLGSWTPKLRTAGAGGVFGWDWEVYAGTDAGYTAGLLEKLCSRDASLPWTMQHWFRWADPRYQYGPRTVAGHFAAADSFALWPPSNLHLDSLSTPHALPGEQVVLHGQGFGTTPGQVFFGAVQATVSPNWWDYWVTATVPQGLPPGPIPVTLKTGGETSNAVEIFIQDDLFDVLHEVTYLEIYFKAHHMWDPWDIADEQAFSLVHQRLNWDGNLFFGQEREVTPSQSRRIDIYGAVDIALRTCTLEYEYADTVHYSDPEGAVYTYKRARFKDVPFDYLTGDDAIFNAEGIGVQANVEGLQWSRTASGDPHGARTGHYLETRWDWSEDARLNLAFGFPWKSRSGAQMIPRIEGEER